MSDGIALEVRGVHKSFRRNHVLRGADLDVERGSMVAVVGENGSGKTTLLRILSGDLVPDRGMVKVNGTLGYCPQQPLLNDSLTVAQHVAFFAAAYRLASTSRAEQLIDRLDFGRYRDAVAGELSGGTRQKLNLTLSLMHDPDVLLLDEPYQGFDWETYLGFWKLVEELRTRGRAVVIISHLVFEEGRFDSLLSLREGRIVRQRAAVGATEPTRV